MLWTFSNDEETVVVDEWFPSGSRPESIERDGLTLHYNLRLTHGGLKDTPGNWPMESFVVGVNPEQVDEAIAADRRNGVPAEYNRDNGDKIFRSASDRKAWSEKYEFYDRNGGYSDPQRK